MSFHQLRQQKPCIEDYSRAKVILRDRMGVKHQRGDLLEGSPPTYVTLQSIPGKRLGRTKPRGPDPLPSVDGD